MNSFVSVFVSGMSGQCQKYVANFEVMGIPPKLGAGPRKENDPNRIGGGSVSKNSYPIFCLFPWRSVVAPGPRSGTRFAPGPVPGPVPLVRGELFGT